MQGTNGVPRNSVNGVSKKFKRMSEMYRYFARLYDTLDFSDDALLSLFNHESYGTELSEQNGFAVGKKFLNLQVTMWREDLMRGWLFKYELYEDPDLPHWFLDSVLKDLYSGMTNKDILNACEKDFLFGRVAHGEQGSLINS